jgi:hypothetical protein
LDVIERVIESPGSGVVLEDLLKRPISQDCVYVPNGEEVLPFSAHYVLHGEFFLNLFLDPVSNPEVLAQSFYPMKGGVP